MSVPTAMHVSLYSCFDTSANIATHQERTNATSKRTPLLFAGDIREHAASGTICGAEINMACY